MFRYFARKIAASNIRSLVSNSVVSVALQVARKIKNQKSQLKASCLPYLKSVLIHVNKTPTENQHG